jgi:hypothetical protein
MWDKRNLRQVITLENLFVLFIFCNPTDNFDVGVDSSGFLLAEFGKASCSLLLALLTMYCGKAFWQNETDLFHHGGNM